MLPGALQRSIESKTPTLWINEHWRAVDTGAFSAALDPGGMHEAEARPRSSEVLVG